MKDVGKIVGIFVLAITGGLTVGVLSVILNGWALMHLWYWFVYPLGVRPIGIAQAIGLAIVARTLTNNDAATEKRSLWQNLAIAFARPVVTVLIGALVARFMA